MLAASLFFYMAFVPAYILILGALILIDYLAAIWIEKAKLEDKNLPSLKLRRARKFLILSIISTCLVLFIFKYFSFFAVNVNTLARFLKWNYSLGFLKIALPLGLSFHTFQSLSYVVEVYRGKQKAERCFGIYALYVMFYPQLVAGPIERPQHLLPQLYAEHSFEAAQVFSGLRRMLWGFFKKIVIADRLAFFVAPVFNNPSHFSGISFLAVAFYFAIQLYCDFSGYVDIALGSAEVMGIKLTENFKQPYFSPSVSEFWRRWHISLSNWIRDYIFTPLSFKWRSWRKFGLISAALLTFLVVGLWHGANWTFVVFGLLQGTAISAELLVGGIKSKWGIIYTFLFWCFSLIFFRAQSLADAFYIVTHLFTGIPNYFYQTLGHFGSAGSGILKPFLMGQAREEFLILAVVVILLFLVEWFESRKVEIKKWPLAIRWSAYYLLIFSILFYGVFQNTPFIYFQF